MKRLLIFLMLGISLALNAQGLYFKKSQVKQDSIYSEILSAWIPYNIYLPESYEKDTLRKYPILYMLHGMGETYTAWYERRRFKDVMDLLVSSGEASQMIVVTPNAGGNVEDTWNGYFNMPGWSYQDFFFEEFIPFIEKTYRAIGDKPHRAITGLSMGGGGATSYALKHPEMFCAVYAMSALMDIPKSEDSLSDDPNSKISLTISSVKENSCVKFVETIDDNIKDSLREVKWFIDCGDDDFLLDSNIDFFHAMKEAKIPIEFRIRDGGHVHEYWHSALYLCLPFVSRQFKM